MSKLAANETDAIIHTVYSWPCMFLPTMEDVHHNKSSELITFLSGQVHYLLERCHQQHPHSISYHKTVKSFLFNVFQPTDKRLLYL